jgi:hypothetical protein
MELAEVGEGVKLRRIGEARVCQVIAQFGSVSV